MVGGPDLVAVLLSVHRIRRPGSLCETPARQHPPTAAPAYYNRRLALHALGHYAAAILDFAPTVAFNPLYAEAHHHLALCYAALGERDRAAAAAQRALELDPGLRERARMDGRT